LHPNDAEPLDDNGVVARVFLEGENDVQYKSILVSNLILTWFFSTKTKKSRKWLILKCFRRDFCE